jgi:hypothetical protein
MTAELSEHASTLVLAAEEAEVVPEQQDRVEALAGLEGAVEGSQPRVGETPLARNIDSEWGNVDPDHLVTAALKVQADAPCAAAEIEDPPAHEPHRAPLLCPPGPERRQVIVRLTGEDATVVALDDFDDAAPGEKVGQHLPEGVLGRLENPAQQAALAGDLFALFFEVDDDVGDRHVEALARGLDDPALEPQ